MEARGQALRRMRRSRLAQQATRQMRLIALAPSDCRSAAASYRSADTLTRTVTDETGAIVADDAAGTVTMTLAGPWGPFLPTIAQSWGSVLEKKWVINNRFKNIK